MWEAGGVPMLLKTLYDGGYIHGDCLTVTGKTMKENLKTIKFNKDQKVLREYNNPLSRRRSSWFEGTCFPKVL